MPKPGDVVTVDFPGAAGLKRRPAVVVSSDAYHAERPDVILGVVTTNLSAATTSSDCVLHDWHSAGLRAPSAFRSYFGMALPSVVHVVGRLSNTDWGAVCVKRALV
jgi:mRNA interferase MazF